MSMHPAAVVKARMKTEVDQASEDRIRHWVYVMQWVLLGLRFPVWSAEEE